MALPQKKKLALAITACLLVQPTFAEKSFELGAGATYFMFDDDLGLEDEFGLRGYFGYRFAEHWGFEAVLDGTNTETEYSGGIAADNDVEVMQGYINALYHFNVDSHVQPYISLGWGQGEFSYDATDATYRSTATNAGLGIKWYMNENWILRPAVNYFVNTEFDEDHVVVGLTLAYAWGGDMSPKPAAVTPPPKPADTDGDGIEDAMDNCPATPSGVTVDSQGCPVDSDADGVADYLDACPDTASKLKVDEQGCPMKLSEEVSIDLLINFDSNSDVVKPQHYAEIRQVASFLEQYEGTEVVIEGHTDSSGAAAYNKALSQRRAEAVAKVLVDDMGIDASRVRAVGYGEEQPLVEEVTRDDMMKNRRVVAKVSTTVETMETK